MLTELRIHTFRAFRKLTVGGLTRVSLLVGANNSGKTSILDAAELLLGATSPVILTQSLSRRGEYSHVETKRIPDGGIRYVKLFNVEHLFHGHELRPSIEFRIEGEALGHRFFSCQVKELSDNERAAPDIFSPQLSLEPPLGLEFSGDRLKKPSSIVPLNELGRLTSSVLRRVPEPSDGTWSIRFLGTTSPDFQQINTLWNRVALTPEEERMIGTLQIIEPDITRVAALTGSLSSEGGFFVRLKGSEQRIPLGSMGDGIKRLLVLSLNLVNSAGGYLLVDEIDTGLHHTVMVKMWRLVVEAAKRLNVQVLATTHSLDCVRALAELYEQYPEVQEDVSLHRIERGAETSIRHSADELLAAARHQMEVR